MSLGHISSSNFSSSMVRCSGVPILRVNMVSSITLFRLRLLICHLIISKWVLRVQVSNCSFYMSLLHVLVFCEYQNLVCYYFVFIYVFVTV